MVIKKITNFLTKRDERYDNLYHNYSKIKLDLKNIDRKKEEEIQTYKQQLKSKVAKNLTILFDSVSTLSSNSHNIKSPDVEVQKTMIDINGVSKKLSEVMKRFELVKFEPKDRHYNSNEMEILKHKENSSFEKDFIIKIVKPGLKFEGEIIKKAKVIVAK